MRVSDVLLKAVEILDERGWYKGAHFEENSPTCGVCMLGAIAVAVHGDEVARQEYFAPLGVEGLDLWATLPGIAEIEAEIFSRYNGYRHASTEISPNTDGYAWKFNDIIANNVEEVKELLRTVALACDAG